MLGSRPNGAGVTERCKTCEDGGKDERNHSCFRDAHAAGRRRDTPAAQGTDGTARAAVEQVVRAEQRQHERNADDGEIRPVVDERMAADRQRRDAVDAIVAAEKIQVGDDVDQRDVHCQRADR